MVVPGMAPPQGVTNTNMPGMPPPAGPGMPPSEMPMGPGGPPMPGGPPPGPPPKPEKPPSMLPSHIAKMLAEALNAVKTEAAQGLTEYMGDPRGAVQAKPVDLLRAWRKRNPKVDPLFEKIVNGQSDDEIFKLMYPLRLPMIKYGRRTHTEQVEFAEYMARLDADPKYASLDDDVEDDEDDWQPPKSQFPSAGEELEDDDDEDEDEELYPEEE